MSGRTDLQGGDGAGAGPVTPAPATVVSVDAAQVWRQRFECTCGFAGYRESPAPPSHIKCPRCAGVAVARDASELVS